MGRPKGFKHTEEFKEMMRMKFSGENNPFYGKSHSEETRQKMSDNHADVSGDNNPFMNSLQQNEEKVTQHKERCLQIWSSRNRDYRLSFGRKLRKGYKEIHGNFWSRVKSNAKARRKEVLITIEESWNIFCKQEGRCKLSDVKIGFGETYKDETTASLDRINSADHYAQDNVQWVHKIVNIMKGKLDEEMFVDYCCLIAAHRRGYVKVKPSQ